MSFRPMTGPACFSSAIPVPLEIMRELWMSSVDGSNPRKVGTIGPLPPDAWGYDVSPTNQIGYTG